MHFNIWVNDNLVKEMESIMKETGHKRNKIITEAITEGRSRKWKDSYHYKEKGRVQ